MLGNLNLIENSESGKLKKGTAEIERMLRALIKSLENKPLIGVKRRSRHRGILVPLEPWPLFSN